MRQYQVCTQKFWRGGAGGHRAFIQFDLKNCSNKYNSNTVYNCIYIHTNISMFHDSPN